MPQSEAIVTMGETVEENGPPTDRAPAVTPPESVQPLDEPTHAGDPFGKAQHDGRRVARGICNFLEYEPHEGEDFVSQFANVFKLW